MKPFLLFLAFILPTIVFASSEPVHTNNKEYSQWISAMKSSERGPFVNVRWFCQDGSVLPPKAYACRDHGGGFQHGNYSQQTKTLRSKGYYIANFLAGIDAKAFIQNDTFIDQYNQILIEKFLGHLDNGWILRKAQFYRGAIQEEDERAGARNLLMELSGQPAWISHRYLGLRSGVRLLPHGKDTASMQKMRQLAASLSDSDRGFKKIRIKIHGSPDASDAQMVRDYVTEKQPEDKAPYLELVDEIDAIYKASPLSDTLRADAKIYSGAPWLQDFLRKMADDLEKNDLENNSSTIKQYQITATALADMREFMPRIKSASARLRLLDLSLIIEAHNFKSSTELHKVLDKMTRSERLSLLENIAQASYGAGIINQRSYAQIKQSIESLNKDKIALKQYINELNYLARVPGWGTQGMRFQFYASMQKLGAIEPLSFHFIQDQLRGSPLMFFSQVLNDLSIDVNHLSGVKHSIFGKKTGIGFHALNPGFVRGTLHTDIRLENIAAIKPDGIYLLPETVSDLPPLSGIITAGEGNPLSHVQLLARNLGIPNVTISEDLIASLEQHNGEIIVMAVSPLGLVEIMSDSPKWREYFNKDSNKDNIRIRPDLEKLDVKFREFINLKELRAKDSGRIVGPKAAKLGELKHIYPDKVANGLAIPFGIFRASVLDKPYKNTSKTVYQWMLEQYDIIRSLESKPAQHEQKSEAFRAELYDIIMHSKMSDALIASFRKAMQDAFGTTNLGVFVRSDTNVEDLPGFTGAGLNLTMPNVIGFDNLINAINDVWASPFTKRAFAWRQSHMEKPQYVYPSILLLRSVDNEKSGVMVTEDITTGARDIISVAVNEGVGGAVDGQSAESLRININDGSVKVLATATAPLRRQAASTGGVVALPVSGSDTILQPDEIKQLIAFAKKLVTSQ